MRYKLFVYGTLKKGHSNHYFIKESEFLGEAAITSGYGLAVENLPFLVEDPNGPGCYGELYEVTAKQLADCDILEGHPRFYKRKLVTVENLENKHLEQAYVYVFQGKVEGRYIARF